MLGTGYLALEAGVLSPSSELGVEMELVLLFCFKVVGEAPVLGTHALPGFQSAGPDPA
jgi:hypothetical protein